MRARRVPEGRLPIKRNRIETGLPRRILSNLFEAALFSIAAGANVQAF